MQIPIIQRLIAIIFSIALLWVTLHLIRKHKLREEFALAWFAVSFLIVLFSLFGGLLNRLAALLAVSYAPTLALVLGLLFCLVMLLSQTIMLSNQADHIRDLAQSIALLEHRLNAVEQLSTDTQIWETTSTESRNNQLLTNQRHLSHQTYDELNQPIPTQSESTLAIE